VVELRRANEILKAASGFLRPARRRPTEMSAFIDRRRERFGAEPICRSCVRLLTSASHPCKA
jgi:hypothetical protein